MAARERDALAMHRAIWRGAALPPVGGTASHATRLSTRPPTFAHGFFLLFSLILAVLRDPYLRGPYLRLVMLRGAFVLVVGILAVASGCATGEEDSPDDQRAGVIVLPPAGDASTRRTFVGIRNWNVQVDEADHVTLVLAGTKRVLFNTTSIGSGEPTATKGGVETFAERASRGWASLLALLAAVSAAEFGPQLRSQAQKKEPALLWKKTF